MSDLLPTIYLARHAETAWSLNGQHTGLTDVPLTERGQRQALQIGDQVRTLDFAKVFTSPLQRASRTCELAGFNSAEVNPNLVEWDYGAYEGLRTVDIRKLNPDWQFFRDGCPNGESPQQVGERAERFLQQVRAVAGNVLLFSSGHFLRVLTARWLNLEPLAGRLFALDTASLSKLGYDADRTRPVIRLWNDTHYLHH